MKALYTVDEVLSVQSSTGTNSFLDERGGIWIPIGDEANDPGAVYMADGITGTIINKDGVLTVRVDEYNPTSNRVID